MSDQLPDPFEFMKKLWSPMGLPMPGMVTPTLDVEVIAKKIADLQSVENWLTLNLNMLRLSIQGLEMQKNTLNAMKAMGQGMSAPQAGSGAQAPAANPFADASAAWMNLMQQAVAQARPVNDKPAGEKPAQDKPAGEKPAQDKPFAENPKKK